MFNLSFFFPIFFLLYSGSVNSLELNCEFHSFLADVNGVKTDHKVGEKDIISIYHEPENEWLWDYSTDALQDDINVWKEENNYSYYKSKDFVSSKIKVHIRNDELDIDSKRQNIPNELHRSRALKLNSKMNLTLITDNLLIYNYYEKKVIITKDGSCN